MNSRKVPRAGTYAVVACLLVALLAWLMPGSWPLQEPSDAGDRAAAGSEMMPGHPLPARQQLGPGDRPGARPAPAKAVAKGGPADPNPAPAAAAKPGGAVGPHPRRLGPEGLKQLQLALAAKQRLPTHLRKVSTSLLPSKWQPRLGIQERGGDRKSVV